MDTTPAPDRGEPEPADPDLPSATPAEGHDRETETWRSLLLGTDPGLRTLRRWWRRVPSSPRCKVCAAPFEGPGRFATRLLMHGRTDTNKLLCNLCFGSLVKQPGGAEIELSILFADVRGSTAIAERTSAAGFRDQLQHVYRIAASAIERHDGIVDKFLGDGVMALFIPVLTGDDHAGRAIRAGAELLATAERHEMAAAGVRVGAGIHSGTAFVGTIGTGSQLDFSALGDTVNVAARLGSAAGPGELLVSRVAWERAGRTTDPAAVREIELTGRTATIEVVTGHPGAEVDVPAA